MLKQSILGLLWVFITASMLSTAQDIASPDIAWVVDGQLWLGGAGLDPAQVETESIVDAKWSPSRQRLAYVHTSVITIIDISQPDSPIFQSEEGRLGEDHTLAFIEWAGDDVLWFNSLPNDGWVLGEEWLLWRLDLSTGALVNVSDNGRNSIAFPNPTGEIIVWYFAGIFEDIPANLTFYDSQGRPLGSYDFPAVGSGSHFGWILNTHWVDDQLFFAQPAPDLVYTFEAPYPATKLMRIEPNGTATELGGVEARFPAELVWSPDAAHVAYIDADNRFVVHDIENATDDILLENVTLGAFPVGWRDWLVLSDPVQGLILWASVEDNSPEIIADARDFTFHDSSRGLVLQGGDTFSIAMFSSDDGEIPIATEIEGISVFLVD